MATALRFLDHPGFQRTFLAMAAGAAAGGGLAGLAGIGHGHLIGGMVGALAGLTWAERPRRAWAMGARLVAATGGLTAVALGAGLWPVAIALGLGLAVGATRRRALAVMIAGAAAGVIAAWASGQVATAQETAPLASWMTGALSGLALGLGSTLALAARHVSLVPDPVTAAYRGLPPLVGEPHELVERGRTIWMESQGLQHGDESRELVADGVLKLFAVASRLATTRAIDPSAVDRRIGELDQRIAACTDPVAREQFRDARTALVDQRRYADKVGSSRERIIARMHHCVATLEKFRMACAQLDASAAAREAADARNAVSVLGELGDGLSMAHGEMLAAPAAAAAAARPPAATAAEPAAAAAAAAEEPAAAEPAAAAAAAEEPAAAEPAADEISDEPPAAA